jgi:hypothetical protein
MQSSLSADAFGKKPILVEGLDPIYKLGHPIQE